MDKEFEAYWEQHRKRLIGTAPARFAEERKRSLGMNTAADWLLWIMPIAVTVLLMDYEFVESGLLNIIILLVICMVCVVLCQMAKPYVTGKRNVDEIDEDIKQYYYTLYKRNGKPGNPGF